MNIFICGQKSFGKAILKILYESGYNIVGVAPPPQEKYYDKMQVYALKLGIPVISDCDQLISMDIPDNTDLVIAAHSHWYISDKIIQKAKYGAIGFHPSLLPRHRGQDAIRWAVAMGDMVTGATVYWLNQVVDGGDILLQKHIFIDRNQDYHELWKRIFPIGIEMLLEAVGMIEKGVAPKIKQDEKYATWEPSFNVPRLKRNELPQIERR